MELEKGKLKNTHCVFKLILKWNFLYLQKPIHPNYLFNCLHPGQQRRTASRWTKFSNKLSKYNNGGRFLQNGRKYPFSPEKVLSPVVCENVLLCKKGGWQWTRGCMGRGWPYVSTSRLVLLTENITVTVCQHKLEEGYGEILTGGVKESSQLQLGSKFVG